MQKLKVRKVVGVVVAARRARGPCGRNLREGEDEDEELVVDEDEAQWAKLSLRSMSWKVGQEVLEVKGVAKCAWWEKLCLSKRCSRLMRDVDEDVVHKVREVDEVELEVDVVKLVKRCLRLRAVPSASLCLRLKFCLRSTSWKLAKRCSRLMLDVDVVEVGEA
eukprot:4495839-Amphidinium_carterae.1